LFFVASEGYPILVFASILDLGYFQTPTRHHVFSLLNLDFPREILEERERGGFDLGLLQKHYATDGSKSMRKW
jgi:hypothetical protein